MNIDKQDIGNEEQWFARLQEEFDEAVKKLTDLEERKLKGENVDKEISNVRDFIETVGEQINDYEFRKGKNI